MTTFIAARRTNIRRARFPLAIGTVLILLAGMLSAFAAPATASGGSHAAFSFVLWFDTDDPSDNYSSADHPDRLTDGANADRMPSPGAPNHGSWNWPVGDHNEVFHFSCSEDLTDRTVVIGGEPKTVKHYHIQRYDSDGNGIESDNPLCGTPLDEPDDPAEIKVKKTVLGDDAPAGAEYGFAVTCDQTTFDPFTLTNGAQATLSHNGDLTGCTVVETDPNDADTITWQLSGAASGSGSGTTTTSFDVSQNASATATFTNAFDAPPPPDPATIVVSKTVDGDGDAPTSAFGFALVCDDTTIDTFTLADGAQTTLTSPDGFENCAIVETVHHDADTIAWVLGGVADGSGTGDTTSSFTVDVEETATVDFTNTFDEDPVVDPATIVVSKTVDGDGDAPTSAFGFALVCDDTTIDTFTLADGAQTTLTSPDGFENCAIVETVHHDADTIAWVLGGVADGSGTGDTTSSFTVDVEETATVDFTNTFDVPPPPDEPAIELTKTPSVDTYANVGDQILYTFTVENIGNVPLTDVEVYDETFDVDITLGTTSLGVGDTTSGTYTHTITQDDLDAGEILNEASVTGVAPDDSTVSDEDDAHVTAEQNPSIALDKVVTDPDGTPPTVEDADETIDYAFTVTNDGNVTLTDVTLLDDLIGAVTLVDGDGQPLAAPVTLAPGEQVFATGSYDVTQGDINSGSIVNIAEATGTPPSGPDVSDDDTQTVEVLQGPAIHLVKSSDRDTYDAVDDDVVYSFTVTNTGNVTLDPVVLTDDLLGFEVQLGTMEPGDVVTFDDASQTTHTVTQANMDDGEIVNVASVTGTAPDNSTVTSGDDVTVTTERNADILLTKTADPTTVDGAGDEVEYTLTIENTGNVTLTQVSLVDPMLGGSIPLDTTTLAPGATTSVDVDYTVTQADADAGSIINTAVTTGYDPDDEPVSDDDSATVTVVSGPDIELDKSADQTEGLEVGDVVTYTFTVTNTGNVTLDPVVLDDPMLGLTTTLGSLAPGASTTTTATHTVTQDDVDRGEIHNEAEVTGTPPDDEDVTDEDDETVTTVDPDPQIGLVKQVNPTVVDSAGTVVTYTFTVTNTGNVTLDPVVLDDDLVGDVTLANDALAPGQSTTGQASYTVTQDDIDAGSIQNVATATGTPPVGDDVTAEDPATVDVTSDPGITLTKTATPQFVVEAGQVVTYNFVVANTGNVTLTDVELDDPMLGGAIALGVDELAPGASTTGQATYEITQEDMDEGGTLDNVATVTGQTPDDDEVSDEDDATVGIIQNPSIQIVKSVDASDFEEEGDEITYTITVTNTGNVTLTDVEVDDPMLGGQLDLATTTLAPGASTSVEVDYEVTEDDIDDSPLVNTATTTGTPPEGDDVTDEDDATVIFTVVEVPGDDGDDTTVEITVEVLGEQLTRRPATEVLGETLAFTGVPAAVLFMFGLGSLLVGAGMILRRDDNGPATAMA